MVYLSNPPSIQIINYRKKASAITELTTPTAADHTLVSTASTRPELLFDALAEVLVAALEDPSVTEAWLPAAPDVLPRPVVTSAEAVEVTDMEVDVEVVGTAVPPVVALAAKEGAGLTIAAFTKAPVPHGILSPFDWVALGAGSTSPVEDEMAKRVVHVGLETSLGEMNW